MGANIKAVRARMKSVDSTRHITKAMELVASSKIRRASERMESSLFYRGIMLDAFAALSAEKSRYSSPRDRSLPALYIVIAGDRGLAGGYNNNIFRSATAVVGKNDLVLPIGKRAVEHFGKSGEIVTDKFTSAENFSSSDSAEAARIVRDLYDDGRVSSVTLIFTRYISMLSQEPDVEYLLPLGRKMNPTKEETGISGQKALVEYEPDAETLLAALISEYISGVLYSCVAESFASELAARRSAMDTATKNADAMLEELSLKYNRARQGEITQEITEIIAGANA